jgi:hypothetical protein
LPAAAILGGFFEYKRGLDIMKYGYARVSTSSRRWRKPDAKPFSRMRGYRAQRQSALTSAPVA